MFLYNTVVPERRLSKGCTGQVDLLPTCSASVRFRSLLFLIWIGAAPGPLTRQAEKPPRFDLPGNSVTVLQNRRSSCIHVRSRKIQGSVRILLAENERRVAGFIARGLCEQGYTVDIARDVEGAAFCGSVNEYDLIIVDAWLPAKDGHSVCRELRRSGFRAPILMLTLDAIDDPAQGLDCGADDYLTMPCDFKELLARLRVLPQRVSTRQPPVARVADLTLDTNSHTVERAGKPVSLTAKEYALLEILVLNENRVVGREQIARYVWDDTFDPLSEMIDVYIKRLRGKLDTGFSRRLIHSRRGDG